MSALSVSRPVEARSRGNDLVERRRGDGSGGSDVQPDREGWGGG